jgi:hypothetical protein
MLEKQRYMGFRISRPNSFLEQPALFRFLQFAHYGLWFTLLSPTTAPPHSASVSREGRSTGEYSQGPLPNPPPPRPTLSVCLFVELEQIRICDICVQPMAKHRSWTRFDMWLTWAGPLCKIDSSMILDAFRGRAAFV